MTTATKESLKFFDPCPKKTSALQEKLDPIKIPVSDGGGLGLCSFAAMDFPFAIISIDCRSETPTEEEVKLLECALHHNLQYYYEHYREKLLAKKYVIDSGSNTAVFRKFGDNQWAYRRISWEYGPYMVPPEGAPLAEVIERMNNLVRESWAEFQEKWFKAKEE